MNSLPIKILLLLLCLVAFCAFPGNAITEPIAPPESACLSYVPTAISPNGDGINDAFVVEQACELKSFRLEIYDPAERLIFESRDVRRGWDGYLDGVPAPEGAYSWVITYRSAQHERPLTERGELVLVR
ncbi:MAG: gliding motility-associated C-terminal domain-containing protein [Bacteroidetes bacterium]|nr:MAG: gliding motility-associated C-terminal domain-containing protein [Bacteroidota bacterium]